MKLFLHHILNVLFTSPDCMAADIINTYRFCSDSVTEVSSSYTGSSQVVYSSAVSEVSEGRGSGYGVWGEWGRMSVCSGRARMKTRYGWCQGHMLFPLSCSPSSRPPFPHSIPPLWATVHTQLLPSLPLASLQA